MYHINGAVNLIIFTLKGYLVLELGHSLGLLLMVLFIEGDANKSKYMVLSVLYIILL